jgi:hypothetical protein
MVSFLFRVPTLLKPSQSCFYEIINETPHVFGKLQQAMVFMVFTATGERLSRGKSKLFVIYPHMGKTSSYYCSCNLTHVVRDDDSGADQLIGIYAYPSLVLLFFEAPMVSEHYHTPHHSGNVLKV